MSRRRGFTLLEVMIAMSILAGAMTWLAVGVARAIKAENHAKLMTVATFLARQRLSEFEDELFEKGFGEFEKKICEPFSDKAMARFSWCITVDKVELPAADQVQSMISKATEAKQQLNPDAPKTDSAKPGDSASNPAAGAAGMFGTIFPLVKDILEQGIRRVTVEVLWREGSVNHQVTATIYFTDVRRVDQSIQINANPGGTSGTPPASSTPPATTTPSVPLPT